MIDFVRREIELSEEWADAIGIASGIQFVVAVAVVECGEAMLPSGRRRDSEFHTSDNGIQVGMIDRIGRHQCIAVEIPLPGKAGMAVGMAKARANRGVLGQRGSDISTLERIGKGAIDSFALRVELVAKDVVVEASASSSERG